MFPSAKEMWEKVIAEVKPESQGELRSNIEYYKESFPEKLAKGHQPKRAIEHSIKLEPGMQPASRPLYKLSLAGNDELRPQMELLKRDFIKPSRSSYGVPILFVPKKDGRWRL